MFKRLVKGALIGAAAFMVAIPAQAATIEVNIFGASAQYNFWTSAAPKYLAATTATGGAGCTTVQHAATSGSTFGGSWEKRDAGVAKGTGCGTASDTIYVSYTTYASIEGIRAAKGNVNDPDSCGNNNNRGVPNYTVSGSTGVTWGPYPGTAGTVNVLACKDIDVGASDVAGETFGQESHGAELGPIGGDPIDVYANAESTTGLSNCRPIIVPFSFFAHRDSMINTEFNWGYSWWDYEAGFAQGNITRLMATSIFSGTVFNWSDFGLSSQEIKVCMRHAGSGTHATLDAGVMRGDAPLMSYESTSAFITPVVYFNKGSSDMMKCIRELGAGTIGYADSDKNGGNWDGSTGSYPTVWRLEYMGEDGTAKALINGIYDFWSAQWLYYKTTEETATKAKITSLCSYASKGANIPSDRSEFWAAEGSMKLTKDDDFSWPKRK